MDLLDAGALEHKRVAAEHHQRRQQFVRDNRASQDAVLGSLKEQAEAENRAIQEQMKRDELARQKAFKIQAAAAIGCILVGLLAIGSAIAYFVTSDVEADESKSLPVATQAHDQ